MSNPLKILISVYACGPKWGSEIGMGWNWVIHLTQHCELTVLTELGFKDDIEEVLPTLNLKYLPKFCFIDIGDNGRKLFWKQGSLAFYYYYRKWQLKAYDVTKQLLSLSHYDIVHQLNMIGFREPGYLWQIKEIPYIIGPVGGYEQFPVSYLSLLNFRDICFYLSRSVINYFQMKYLIRPKKAYQRATYVLAATKKGASSIAKYSINPSIVIPETGANKPKYFFTKGKANESRINLVWCGIINGRKGLPIALYSIADLRRKDSVHLHVIGYGPNLEKSKKLAQKLQLKNVTWYGRISNKQSKQIIANSDILFFTSLLDATSTVIFEALESQTPVLCHDSCGFGFVIDQSCGIKIPMVNVSNSIHQFSKAIDEIIEDPQKLELLKVGCLLRIKEFYWESKAKQLYELYKQCCS